MKIYVVKDLDTGLYYQGGCQPSFGDERKAKRYKQRNHAITAVVQWYGTLSTPALLERIKELKERYPSWDNVAREENAQLAYRKQFPRLSLIGAEIIIQECDSIDILNHIETRGGK